MKNIEHYLEKIVVLSFPLLAYIAYINDWSKEIIHVIISILVIVVFIVRLILYPRYKTTNEEVNFLKTLSSGKLNTKILGNQQKFDLDVLIVEDSSSNQGFVKSLKNAFKEDVKEADLKIHSFSCEDSNINDQIDDLSQKLKAVKAVLVSWNEKLDTKEWALKVVEQWAINNPDLPCLYVKEKGISFKKDSIASRYLFIPKSPKSVPWRLMQRATDRSNVWKYLADLNKKLINLALTLVMAVTTLLAYSVISTSKANTLLEEYAKAQQQELQRKLEKNYTGSNELPLIRELRDQVATRSKEEFEHKFLKGHDKFIFVSYWIKDKDKPFPIIQIGTSDVTANRTPFSEDVNSVIGCAFIKSATLVGYTGNKTICISDFKCEFTPQPEKNIKSLYCYALRGSRDDEPSVGICLRQDSSSNTKISTKDLGLFLPEKAREFYKLEIDLRKKISAEANKSTN